jgi:hypothetical protein
MVLCVALVDLDLLHGGVALDVEQAVAHQQLLVQLLRAAHVQDRIRLAVERVDGRPAEARCRVLRQIPGPERPAPREPVVVGQPGQDTCRMGEIFDDLEGHRVIGDPCGVLDVIHLVPEPLQPHEVVDVLPHHPGDGARPHESHDHDALAFHRATCAPPRGMIHAQSSAPTRRGALQPPGAVQQRSACAIRPAGYGRKTWKPGRTR